MNIEENPINLVRNHTSFDKLASDFQKKLKKYAIFINKIVLLYSDGENTNWEKRFNLIRRSDEYYFENIYSSKGFLVEGKNKGEDPELSPHGEEIMKIKHQLEDIFSSRGLSYDIPSPVF